MEVTDLARLCGPRATASHQTAADLWQLETLNAGPPALTVPRNRGRLTVPGWKVYRRDLAPQDVVVLQGIRLTTPLRTVLDLSRSLPLEEAVVVADSALRVTPLEVDQVQAVLARAWGHHSARARAVAPLVDAQSESVLESLLAVVLHLGDVPPPLRQHVVRESDGTFVARVDFCWPRRRLVVEADGFAFHSDRAAYRRDRDRLNALERLGWRVLRFSWEDVRERPVHVVRTVTSCLGDAAT
ncbi:MAG: hypothetical protein JWL64_268 [Frankiales bacterium]|nr:hypothetical protein [Frankiales bacterium]